MSGAEYELGLLQNHFLIFTSRHLEIIRNQFPVMLRPTIYFNFMKVFWHMFSSAIGSNECHHVVMGSAHVTS